MGYRIYGGQLSFDRILALPEETVHFREDAFEVGGTAFRRVSDRMPKAGEVDVPKGAYYIWPVAVRYGHGGGDQTEGLSSLAVVGQGDVIGAAYRRWFWRSYELEPLVELKR